MGQSHRSPGAGESSWRIRGACATSARVIWPAGRAGNQWLARLVADEPEADKRVYVRACVPLRANQTCLAGELTGRARKQIGSPSFYLCAGVHLHVLVGVFARHIRWCRIKRPINLTNQLNIYPLPLFTSKAQLPLTQFQLATQLNQYRLDSARLNGAPVGLAETLNWLLSEVKVW